MGVPIDESSREKLLRLLNVTQQVVDRTSQEAGGSRHSGEGGAEGAAGVPGPLGYFDL